MKKTQFKETQIIKVQGFPKASQIDQQDRDSLIIFDQILLNNSSFRRWVSQFPLRIPVRAGETLKTINQYAKILNQIQKWQKQNKISQRIQVVAIGGGSVGDFAGFLAATYQRGCRLVQVPSTWLAAIDSAHGGKNGLNLNETKNQVGTIYPADKIILSKQLLANQPAERLSEAFGEIIKICLINRSALYPKIEFTEKFVWNNLEKFISGKMHVVNADPFEQSGHRHILNLGHTMGHVYESVLKISHGEAVLMGLVFAARWSFHLGYMTQKSFIDLAQLITDMPDCDLDFAGANKISTRKISEVLRQDKKAITAKQKTLRFIFIKRPGKVFAKSKTVSEIVQECDRQRFHT